MAFVLKLINPQEVDLTAYENFVAKCKNLNNLTSTLAFELALEAANLSEELSKIKALLAFTANELERQTKLIYSNVFLEAANINPNATSDQKRDAVARQNTEYQNSLQELAKIKTTLSYVEDCLEYLSKLHYIFRMFYSVELKLPIIQ